MSDLWLVYATRHWRRWLSRAWRNVTRWWRWRGARGRTSPAYNAFMAGPEWRAQRQRALRRDGYRCRWCGGPGREAHHLYYLEPIGATPDEAIVALCGRCHVRAHQDKRQAPTSRRLW